MGERPPETTRGDLGDAPEETPAGTPGGSGFVTTKVAAQSLGVNPRTIRTYIERGDLEAKVEGEGIQKMYLVSIDSLYALRDQRGYPRHSRGQNRDRTATGAEVPPGELAEVIRDLTAELVQKAASEAELRTRLELSAQAESSVQAERERLLEDLARERARADRLEAELQEARNLSLEPRDGPETATSSEGSLEEGSVPPEQPAQSRSWWRRFFGFE
jgi:hypothetical protein